MSTNENPDVVCEHGTAMDVHCCNCHSGFIFDKDHECPDTSSSVPVRASGEPQKAIRERPIQQLRDVLSMLCNYIWTKNTRSGEHLWSIPVDQERDFDCILSDAIDELEHRRAAASPSDDGARQPAPASDWLKVIHAIAVEAMTAQSDPNAEAIVYRKALIGICDMALKAQAAASDDGAARPQPAQGKGAKVTCACGGKLLWSPVRGLLCENCTAPDPALSSPSVAQGWTALDGFTLDRIEQTLKTIGVISSNDDSRWLVEKLLQIVKAKSRIDLSPSVADSQTPLTALFLPLRREFYDGFAAGAKKDELRRYGPRWNEKTCVVGRGVVLSCGYGKAQRLTGRISSFKKQHGSTFGSTYRASIEKVYGTLDVWIACIGIVTSEHVSPPSTPAGAAQTKNETS